MSLGSKASEPALQCRAPALCLQGSAVRAASASTLAVDDRVEGDWHLLHLCPVTPPSCQPEDELGGLHDCIERN